MCQSPAGSNCMVLHENVTSVTTGKERSWVEPCTFSILSLEANFPSTPHKQSGQCEKGGTQYPMDNTPLYPKRKKDWCCNVMSVSNMSTQKRTWDAQIACCCLSMHLGTTAQWCSPGAELQTLKPLECTFPFFLDSWTQCGLIQKHARQRSLQSKVLQLELSTKVLAPLQPLGTNTEGEWQADPPEPYSLLDAGTTQDGIWK